MWQPYSYLGSYHSHDHAHMWQPYKFTLDHIIVMTMPTHVTTIQIYLGSHHSHDHFHTRDHHTYKVTLDPIPRAVCHRHRFKVNSCWESKEMQTNLSKAWGRPEHSTTSFTRGQGFCLSDFCPLCQFIWLVRTVLKYPSLRVIRSTMSWFHPTMSTNCWSCSMRSPAPHTHTTLSDVPSGNIATHVYHLFC